MRSPSPAFIVTSVVLALASTAAGAVTTATTPSTGTTTATAPRTTTGLPGQNVTAAPSTSSSSSTTGTSTDATGVTNPTAATATAIDTTRGATNNSTGPLVGITQGSGTTIGTTNAGSTPGAASPNANNPLNPATGLVNGFVVPGIVTDVRALGDVGDGVNANGERMASNNGAPPNSIVTGGNVFTLPLYDATTQAATAREIRRRERGQEPRVIGMAPRTDNDLTWQMPDDRIIRY